MIHDLLANAATMVSFLLIIGQVFKNNSFGSKQNIKCQSLLGIICGLLGTILMLFSIKMTSSVIIDLRNISIMCAGILGGPVSSIIAGIIIALFRISYFGINDASITALFVALIIGIGTAYLSIVNLAKRKKIILMFFFSMIISSTALVYLIGDRSKLTGTLGFYWLIHVFALVLAYFTCEYIISANTNFKTMLYYRVTADNLSDMISTHEPDGKFKFVSSPAVKMLGYNPSELAGNSAYEYIHPEDIELFKNMFSRATKDKETITEVFRMRRRDGIFIWVESSVKNITDNRNLSNEIVCVTRDITSRREIEQKLRVSNARFKAIFDSAGIGIAVRNKNEEIMEANTAYLDLIGYSKDEVNRFSSIIHPDDYYETLDIFNKLLIGKGTSYRTETRFINKNKEIVYADITSTIIPGTENAPPSIVRVINNITERKKMEEMLSESEERFRAAFDNAAIGMCLAFTDGRFYKTNRAFCDLLGYSEKELVNLNFKQITYPDDMEEDLSLMKKLLSREISHFLLEKRYFHKDGRVIWALLGVSAVFDSENKPLYLVGQIQDITARKQAEKELKKSKLNAEKLASIDFLTGILNRRAFEERFNEEFNRVGREKGSISIILTDIDHFKKINDTYGHQVGDLALQKFARCLSGSCRPYDFIGRHGGEEFVICLPNTDREQALIIAERMRIAVENMIINLSENQETIKLTASFGISSPIKGNEENIHTLILQADRAMYKAKANGRNRVWAENNEG